MYWLTDPKIEEPLNWLHLNLDYSFQLLFRHEGQGKTLGLCPTGFLKYLLTDPKVSGTTELIINDNPTTASTNP